MMHWLKDERSRRSWVVWLGRRVGSSSVEWTAMSVVAGIVVSGLLLAAPGWASGLTGRVSRVVCAVVGATGPGCEGPAVGGRAQAPRPQEIEPGGDSGLDPAGGDATPDGSGSEGGGGSGGEGGGGEGGGGGGASAPGEGAAGDGGGETGGESGTGAAPEAGDDPGAGDENAGGGSEGGDDEGGDDEGGDDEGGGVGPVPVIPPLIGVLPGAPPLVPGGGFFPPPPGLPGGNDSDGDDPEDDEDQQCDPEQADGDDQGLQARTDAARRYAGGSGSTSKLALREVLEAGPSPALQIVTTQAKTTRCLILTTRLTGRAGIDARVDAKHPAFAFVATQGDTSGLASRPTIQVRGGDPTAFGNDLSTVYNKTTRVWSRATTFNEQGLGIDGFDGRGGGVRTVVVQAPGQPIAPAFGAIGVERPPNESDVPVLTLPAQPNLHEDVLDRELGLALVSGLSTPADRSRYPTLSPSRAEQTMRDGWADAIVLLGRSSREPSAKLSLEISAPSSSGDAPDGKYASFRQWWVTDLIPEGTPRSARLIPAVVLHLLEEIGQPPAAERLAPRGAPEYSAQDADAASRIFGAALQATAKPSGARDHITFGRWCTEMAAAASALGRPGRDDRAAVLRAFAGIGVGEDCSTRPQACAAGDRRGEFPLVDFFREPAARVDASGEGLRIVSTPTSPSSEPPCTNRPWDVGIGFPVPFGHPAKWYQAWPSTAPDNLRERADAPPASGAGVSSADYAHIRGTAKRQFKMSREWLGLDGLDGRGEGVNVVVSTTRMKRSPGFFKTSAQFRDDRGGFFTEKARSIVVQGRVRHTEMDDTVSHEMGHATFDALGAVPEGNLERQAAHEGIADSFTLLGGLWSRSTRPEVLDIGGGDGPPDRTLRNYQKIDARLLETGDSPHARGQVIGAVLLRLIDRFQGAEDRAAGLEDNRHWALGASRTAKAGVAALFGRALPPFARAFKTPELSSRGFFSVWCQQVTAAAKATEREAVRQAFGSMWFDADCKQSTGPVSEACGAKPVTQVALRSAGGPAAGCEPVSRWVTHLGVDYYDCLQNPGVEQVFLVVRGVSCESAVATLKPGGGVLPALGPDAAFCGVDGARKPVYVTPQVQSCADQMADAAPSPVPLDACAGDAVAGESQCVFNGEAVAQCPDGTLCLFDAANYSGKSLLIACDTPSVDFTTNHARDFFLGRSPGAAHDFQEKVTSIVNRCDTSWTMDLEADLPDYPIPTRAQIANIGPDANDHNLHLTRNGT